LFSADEQLEIHIKRAVEVVKHEKETDSTGGSGDPGCVDYDGDVAAFGVEDFNFAYRRR
jgi:hypothetical protein